ncbi:MAG: DUF5683 domain-containing protein [Candidatus Stygibacter australis]|nr:DUF5683 domain-containing protein [Candidatus Stygibacter australis]MDP8322267.1 DUF5683 domain-containing protein [Candidatus Stygibacter australis]
MMKTAITLLLIIFIFAVLGAEPVESDSLQIPHRSPFKAGLLSAVIPGGGQVYNHAYIKGAAVLALEGLFLGYSINNHQQADKYYKSWKDTDSQFDYNNYEFHYERYKSQVWWLGITIFLSTLDAVTDAYLYDFDYQKQKIRLKFEDRSVQLEYKF